MIIGIDFDNTIVSYDALFHRVAREQDLIPFALPVNKTAVRDHLRTTGRETTWTEIQGTVYGARIAEAEPYPGVLGFIRTCRRQGVSLRIISHKTRHPYLGVPYDLRAAALGWLQHHGWFSPTGPGLSLENVEFHHTRKEKVQAIAQRGCDVFIDDLPEVFLESHFPSPTAKILFDPEQIHSVHPEWKHARSWTEIEAEIFTPVAA